MKNVHQRFALLAGVSMSALGFAVPAYAATTTLPATSHVDTTDPVDDTLVICNLADDCALGVDASGTGSVTATVDNPATGQILQQGISTGANAALHMTNDGKALIAASASAIGGGGAATAVALITQGVLQSGIGATGVALDFNNDGTLALVADAFASADGTSAQSAIAHAGVTGAKLFASVTGTGDAAIDADNEGTLTVSGLAHAVSGGPAIAQATAVYGIGATAQAANGNVAVNVHNGGDLQVVGSAQATGLHAATAVGLGVGGMVAVASGHGSGDAIAAIVNDGSMLIEGDAAAQATTNALAVAVAVTGIYDIAHAATGNALASVANNGRIDIVANATATALVAQATAIAGGALFAGGVFESAAAANGSAHGVMSNDGTITIDANARANGSVIAYANAFGGPGVNQLVFANNGNAVADMTNSGSILVSADAEAVATNSAFAAAGISNAFNNAAFATSGDALVNIGNSGTIAVDVTAHARDSGIAGAQATASHVIGHIAFAFGGDAGASFDNSGAIAIGVDAEATAILALASASLTQGIYQSAFAFMGGSADASLTNGGTIDLRADAHASGFFAGATAILQSGVIQNAMASSAGNAAVAIANDGTIAIGAVGSAIAAGGPARAIGAVGGGLVQAANAFDGTASASLTNAGELNISAVAHARGAGALTAIGSGSSVTTFAVGATAVAVVSGGVVQTVGGFDGASVTLANNGGIDITASADAEGPGFTTHLASGTTVAAGPFAFAELAGGLVQAGSSLGGNVGLTLANGGEINLVDVAHASSTGVGPAAARAWLFTAVAQSAHAGTGDAAAAIDNSGSLAIDAVASATASTAAAHASVELIGGMSQRASAAGLASASLSNSGSIEIVASAEGRAPGSVGQGGANISGGIVQFASGFATVVGSGASAETHLGDAHVSIDNSASILITAIGSGTGASAMGNGMIATGIAQFGFAAGSASAAIDNSGDLSLVAMGSAAARDGGADAGAGVLVGIGQRVAGQTANAAIDNSGNLVIAAGANAVAATAGGDPAGSASAVAHLGGVTFLGVHGAINQEAAGTEASIGLTNSGSLSLGAVAVATGTAARAGANLITGIKQHVRAFGGTATASIENGGTLEMAASAVAHATGSTAHAVATIGGAVEQDVFAVNGDAFASFDNSGTLDLSAFAEASGTGDAFAVAIANGIGQNVNAFATGTGIAAPSASALFTNSGELDVTAIAKATGGTHTAATKSGGPDFASAIASANAFGVAQFAADATLINSGTMSVAVGAMAQGNIFTNARSSGRLAFQQAMNFAGDASAAFTNDGTASLAVMASAEANTGVASASAMVSGGLVQAVLASGNATASLTNSGSLAIGELAKAGAATGSAFAHAVVDGGIVQFLAGGSAEADLLNSGTVTVSAGAIATAAGLADAAVNIGGAVVQSASVFSGADLSLDNQGTVNLVGIANANASNDTTALAVAAATANVAGIVQQAQATSRSFSSFTSAGSAFLHVSHSLLGPVSISLANEGDIAIVGKASAYGDDIAFANAAVQVANQFAAGSDVSIDFSNAGTIAASAIADATASQSAVAQAFATGIGQFATAQASALTGTITVGGHGHVHSFNGGAGPAMVSLTNSGTISLLAKAHATATGTQLAASRSWALAAATAIIPIGINQGALGSTASAALTNEGTILIGASAEAHGLQSALAHVEVDGIAQGAIALGAENTFDFTASGAGTFSGGPTFPGDAAVSLINSGSFSVLGVASADADLAVHQQVRVSGVAQVARGLNASATIGNEGTIAVAGSAHGTAVGSVSNFVAASGLNQIAFGPDSVVASVDNSGKIDVSARAIGTAETGNATNIAIAGGIAQDSLGRDGATSSVTNSGSISVVADAESNGGIVGFAGAYAEGFSQDPLFGTLTSILHNDGDIAVLAGASALATGGAYASAKATGLHVDAADVVADVANSGNFTVAASAVASGASGSAYAFAGGISMTAANHGTSGSFGLISGTIENSGSLKVSAKVDSANGGTVGATATGIFLNSGQIDATVVNTGTILVQAVTANGSGATAYGVHAVNWYNPAVDSDAVFTFTNNGGTLIARQSVDGGTTWQRGMAVDVTGAPNKTVVNLLGDGAIYGNIAIQDGDVINVEDGTTLFDGIINPASMPAGGITAAVLDTGLSGPGTLNIDNGGNLELSSGNAVAAMNEGPSYVFVDTLNIGAEGTITYDLPAVTGNAPVGTYPQVFADTANLDGTLVANIQSANGLFETSFYDNVIDANTRNGTFAACELAGPYTNSLLLSLACSYDAQANVDLKLTRTPFDQVAGLNANGVAVGTGLDSYFDVNLTGGAANMFADLFLITDAANYNIALNQLSGSVYANYLNSFPSLGVHYDDLVDHATDCEIPALAGSVIECRSSSPIHIWGQLDYQTRKADGDVEAGDSRSKRFTGLVGVDTNLASATILGIEGGYVSNNVHDSQFGDSAKGNGWQIGAYADYDPGAFFLKGVTTYSSFSGDSTRHINFSGLGTGTSFVANPTGSPDVKMWTFGLHGGARFSMSASSVITPYLNYDYVNAKLDGFDEDNGNGAGLTIGDGKSNHSFLTGGAKWATQMGGVVPELNVGYRYRFGDQRSSVHEWFTPDPENDFDIVSAGQKRGAFLAGVSIGGKVGPVDLRIGYEGEFNGDLTSHSGNFKIVLPLGGHAAPPPPPVAAPAPPPPVAEPAPPPPPPPPPAPVERGERGE